MHISDGVLSAQVLGAGALLAAAGTAVGLKKMDYDQIPKIAVLSSAFFVASFIHVPLGPSSVHLTFLGLTGLLLGWASFPALLTALLLQALLFQHGGITVLGVNTFTMGSSALIVYLLFHRLVKNQRSALVMAGAFCSGVGAVVIASLLTALSLIFSGEIFLEIAKLMVVANLPVMAIEGLFTLFVIRLLRKVKPDILEVPYVAVQKI